LALAPVVVAAPGRVDARGGGRRPPLRECRCGRGESWCLSVVAPAGRCLKQPSGLLTPWLVIGTSLAVSAALRTCGRPWSATLVSQRRGEAGAERWCCGGSRHWK